MKRDIILLSWLSLIVFMALAAFFIIALRAEESERKDVCEEYGCPEYAQYIGSKESNVFHACSCRYGPKIKPENIVCFMNRTEAIGRGYREAEAC